MSRVVYAAVTPPNRAVDVAFVPRDPEPFGDADKIHQTRKTNLAVEKYQVVVEHVLPQVSTPFW